MSDDLEADVSANKKREMVFVDEVSGDKKYDGMTHGPFTHKIVDGGAKHSSNEKVKKACKTGKGTDERYDPDSVEVVKEPTVKDGVGEVENIVVVDKGGNDNNGGKENEIDKNGMGSKGDDKGLENLA